MSDEIVSILIPVYNRESLILETIKSVFDQKYLHFKIIIYDDKSTDFTLQVIKNFRKGLPMDLKKKLQIVEGDKNKGVGYARNQLLQYVATPYACWLDSDDLMHPDRLEKQLEKIKEGFDIVFTYMERFVVKEERRKIRHDIVTIDTEKYSDFDSLKSNTTSPSGFFKRDLQKYPINPGLTLGGEDVLWLYTLIKAGKKVGLVPEPIYYYRFHSDRIGIIKKDPKFSKRKDFESKIISEEVKKLDSSEK